MWGGGVEEHNLMSYSRERLLWDDLVYTLSVLLDGALYLFSVALILQSVVTSPGICVYGGY